MKRMIMVATVPSMIGCFNMNNIRILLDMGYEVHVACNLRDTSVWPEKRIREFIKELEQIGVKYHNVDFSRTPKDMGKIIFSIRQMERLLKRWKFEFVHCHTPMAGVVCRICCHHNKVKVIYTAHGFHFFVGSPLRNWLFYYPIEKIMSYFTDVLITINQEDFRIAKRKFHAYRTIYVPGVGVDIENFKKKKNNRQKVRKKLGLEDGDVMFLSVGELNNNKNYELAIRSIAKLVKTESFSRIQYYICGQGKLVDYLEKIVQNMSLSSHVHLVGFRTDIQDYYSAADIFVSMSKREGLPVSLMEAMASGLPSIVTRVRGNIDLIKDCETGFVVDFNSKEIAIKFKELVEKGEMRDRFSRNAIDKIKPFDVGQVSQIMRYVYSSK